MNLLEAQQFVAQFIKGDYTPGEYAAFLEWLKGAKEEELSAVADRHESIQGEWVLPEGPTAIWKEELERKLDKRAMETMEETVEGAGIVAPVVAMRPRRMIRMNVWVAAATVAIVITGGFLYVHQFGWKSGERADQGKLLSMTMTNPKGGVQKEVVLADGSKVWLNAGSALKYPPRFGSEERLVELSGEAFFDVSATAGRPFRVRIKDAEVEVLGTFFNIMAYSNETKSLTTLVDEGKIKVISGENSVVLKPDEQAEVTYASPGAGTSIEVHSGIDRNAVLAWAGGIYRLDGKDLRTIMRELERVYDVTVQYQPNVPDASLNGMLDLKKGLDTNLRQLEGSLLNTVHFSRNGKIIIVSPV